MDISRVADSPITSFCIFVLIFLARTILGKIDPQYLACVTKTCGDGQNISYPFYIEDQQESFCGYPGFKLSCNNKGNPVLKLSSDTDYIVQKIFYDNHSVIVSNAAVLESNYNDACTFPRIKNFSMIPGEFLLPPDGKEVVLLYNCNNSLPQELSQHKLAGNCSSQNDENSTVLAMFVDDSDLVSASKECDEVPVVAPVDASIDDLRGGIGIREMVRRGFVLKWVASDCSVCEQSGGKCGFDAATYHFQCYCPDRPHAKHCIPESKYEACKPSNCGSGPNISYPFFIRDAGTEFCGYPGFQIHCKENKPIYKTSKGYFTIQNISYENQSFRLAVEGLFNDTCIAPAHNFSLDRSSLVFSPHHADLLFFHSCNDSFRLNYTKSKLRCASNATRSTFVALVPRNKGLNWSAVACDSLVASPVQLEAEEINRTIESFDYVKLLKLGFSLEWTGYNCAACRRSGGRCGFENENSVCFCPDGSHLQNCYDGGKKKLKLGLGIGIGGLAILIAILSTIFLCYHKQKYASANLHSSNNSSGPSSKSDLEIGTVCFGVPIFSYSDLAEATNDFNHEKELGDGGFGTVYYGKLRDGREVAVKRLYEHNYRRVEQFMNEVEILTRVRHKNLVSLYGCTSRNSQGLLLVYEFVPNGTVADHLHGDRAKPGLLTWPIRMNIAIETASALAYLHASDTIHRDVKTDNILLDSNFCVKVADFGLSRLFPIDVTHVSTAPQGTPGYVDPEYHQCYQLTDKSDVYSFGVVLIELISSMPAVDMSRHRNEINLANLAINKIQKCAFDKLIDPCLGYQSDKEVKMMTTSVAELAFLCLQQDKDMRPSMDKVLEELKRIKSGQSKFEKQKEKEDDNEVIISSQPPCSPPYCDADSLLKNIRLPPSPISVTEKWVSNSSSITTPNTSG